MSWAARGSETLDVAACVVRSAEGRVLMAERTAGQISPGFWELPGGKVDPGETPEMAATRELVEEVGLRAEATRPWIAYEHAYPQRRLRLKFFLVERWSGEPRGLEGQRLAWVDPAAPLVSPILPSNQRALMTLALPPVYTTLRSRDACGVDAALAKLRDAFASGARLARLNEATMTPDQRVTFARRANEIARPFGSRVLLTGSALEARRAGVAGLHSSARDLTFLTARPPVPIWAATCATALDLDRAIWLGADFAVIVQFGAGGRDWGGLRELAARSPIPLYVRENPADPAMMIVASQR